MYIYLSLYIYIYIYIYRHICEGDDPVEVHGGSLQGEVPGAGLL